MGPAPFEEPLAELPGPTLIFSGVGLAGILLARGILGVNFLLEVGCQGNDLGLVVWDRLVSQSCVFIIGVEGREIDDALQHIEHRRLLNPLSPPCLDVV